MKEFLTSLRLLEVRGGPTRRGGILSSLDRIRASVWRGREKEEDGAWRYIRGHTSTKKKRGGQVETNDK